MQIKCELRVLFNLRYVETGTLALSHNRTLGIFGAISNSHTVHVIKHTRKKQKSQELDDVINKAI